MPTCFQIAVRHHPTGLHFCFRFPHAARVALDQFTKKIEYASEDELIVIDNGERCAGFLKRDFICVEKFNVPDDDDEDDDDVEPPSPKKRRKLPRSRKVSPVDTATMILRNAQNDEG